MTTEWKEVRVASETLANTDWAATTTELSNWNLLRRLKIFSLHSNPELGSNVPALHGATADPTMSLRKLLPCWVSLRLASHFCNFSDAPSTANWARRSWFASSALLATIFA